MTLTKINPARCSVKPTIAFTRRQESRQVLVGRWWCRSLWINIKRNSKNKATARHPQHRLCSSWDFTPSTQIRLRTTSRNPDVICNFEPHHKQDETMVKLIVIHRSFWRKAFQVLNNVLNWGNKINPKKSQEINLTAPWGFYCGTCRHYLARAKGLLKKSKTWMWGVQNSI